MRRVAKVLAWIVGGVVGVVALIYVALILINWNDRPPSPTALRFEAAYRDRPKVEDVDNGYLFAFAFDAKPGDDVYSIAVKRKQWLKESLASGHFENKNDPLHGSTEYRSQRDAPIQELRKSCLDKLSECADLMQSKSDVVARWMESEGWLRHRYDELLSRSGWYEEFTYDAEAPVPSYAGVLDGQLLLFAEARLLVSKRDLDSANALLARDLRFWRGALASSDLLISKMIIAAALRRHFEIGQGILRQAQARDIERLMPKEWREPMTERELSMRRVMIGEWQFSSRVLRNAKQHEALFLEASGELPELTSSHLSQKLFEPLYKMQDTINQNADNLESLVSAFDAPLEKYPEILVAEERRSREPFENLISLRSTYNPVGKILSSLAAPEYSRYVVRVADIEGVRRVAVVAALLRSLGTAPKDMRAVLAEHALRNPYTQKPFEWEEKEGTILFIGLDNVERRIHRLKY